MVVEYEYGFIQTILDIAGIPYKKVGTNRVMGICPVCGGGHRTPCASYLLDKNIWKCFSCGAGGTVRKLKEVLNLNINEKNYVVSVQEEVYKPADITEDVKPFITRKPDKESLQYLESRGVDYQKIAKFVRFISPKKKWHYRNGFRLTIPAFDKEGRTRNVKIRNVFSEEERKKLEIEMKVISWKGGENYSIGLNWIPEDSDFVLIVEGEMDFLSVKGIDPEFPVLGLPSANYRFKDELKYLPKKVILLLDNDEAGEVHSFRLNKELEENGFKVKVMNYPDNVKDFNDLLLENPQSAKELLEKVKKAFRKKFVFF